MCDLSKITITEIADIRTIHSVKGINTEIKNRYAMGLSFCTEGKIIYKHSGSNFVSDKNCAIILPQRASYELFRIETGYFPLINFFCDNFSPQTLKVIKLKNSESYIRDFEKMHKLSLFSGNRTSLMSIFYDILSRLENENKNTNNIIVPALEEIEENYYNPKLCNNMLADLCGISEVYFRKQFSLQMGISPRQYILDIRIRRAKQLLSTGAMSVYEISETVGFSSVYHFCRAFKEKTGMTPSEYAKRCAELGI